MGRGRNGRRRRKRKAKQRNQSARARIRVQARTITEVDAGTLCPLCRDEIATVDPALLAMRCDGCHTIYHQACFDELGGCSTLGCGRMQQRGGPALQVQARARERRDERQRRHQAAAERQAEVGGQDLAPAGFALVVLGAFVIGSGIGALVMPAFVVPFVLLLSLFVLVATVVIMRNSSS